MEFDNSVLEEMQNKKYSYNTQYSLWYSTMAYENRNLVSYSQKLTRKANRMSSCLNLWNWDVYHKNKLMDLKKLNRCMNNRFCPNCRKWDLSSAIHTLSKPLNKLLLDGYNPYMLTLTIPNVEGEQLRKTIDAMNKAFRKFYSAISYDLEGNNKGFESRYMTFEAALKVLEITYNLKKDTYHPHFHCMFFSKDYDKSLFIKNIPGEYSNKRNSLNYYSEMDIQICKLWTMCFNQIRLTDKNYSSLGMEEAYLCDIREMDSAGIVEVLKYTFKDTDIINYTVFKTLVEALENKRIRQGYGLLYGLNLENQTDGYKIALEDYLHEMEEPERIITSTISELLSDFKDYTKISRYKADCL